MSQALLFIAILPPAQILEEIHRFKQTAAKRFNSKKALNSPPHITLIPPFKFEEKKVGLLEKELKKIAGKYSPFSLQLKNFNAFPPRVIYVDVLNNSCLKIVQADLERSLTETLGLNYDRPRRLYRPHLTIAFKDLKKDVFPVAREYFSAIKYGRIFGVKSISLLRHEGVKWQVINQYFFEE